ncbi:MAG TPA: sialidase family protein [Armatimonadota bacterium]|nr:sialidase family protein [Armatimonadota bacterium]
MNLGPPVRCRRIWLAFTGAVALGAAALGCRPLAPASAQAASPPSARRVELLKTPNGGIQPQAVLDGRGILHLVYLKGTPGACDVFYQRRPVAGGEWSEPLRVNRIPGSAVAVGTIRGAQLAVGRDGRVHVLWAGSTQTVKDSPRGMPLFYSRLDDAGKAFEPERNLMQFTMNLDGGGSIAADAAGSVYVAFHAAEQKMGGEGARRLFLARSRDDGKSWTREVAVNPEPTGACPCCSTKAFVDARGALYVLYRSAQDKTDRGMVLLTSADHGTTFISRRVDPWQVDT